MDFIIVLWPREFGKDRIDIAQIYFYWIPFILTKQTKVNSYFSTFFFVFYNMLGQICNFMIGTWVIPHA